MPFILMVNYITCQRSISNELILSEPCKFSITQTEVKSFVFAVLEAYKLENNKQHVKCTTFFSRWRDRERPKSRSHFLEIKVQMKLDQNTYSQLFYTSDIQKILDILEKISMLLKNFFKNIVLPASP